jgi:Xaa-Pro aminopeptidase
MVAAGSPPTGALPTNGNDAFPMFSDAEMAQRHRRVQAEMARRGVDALIIHGHTGLGNSVGQVNLQYLARYAAVIETFLVLLQGGEPTLFLAIPFHVPNAHAISYVKDIRSGDALGGAVEKLKAAGLAKGRIGIVGPGAVSHNGPTLFHEQHLRLAAALPEAQLQNATPWFDDLRLIKSDEELALLRHAGALTDLAHHEVFRLTREGATPRELRRAMDVLAASAGATYPFGHIGATSMRDPDGYYPDFYPVDAPIPPDALVMTEFALGFGNYWAKLWGSYFVGDPTGEYVKLFETAATVHDTLQRELRPGLSGNDVNAFLEPITAAGLEQPANVLVGGWSALNHPPQMGALPSSLSAPFAKPFAEIRLQPRQTVTIQAWVSIPGTKKGLWVGSSGVITDTGYESLNRYPISALRVAGPTAPPALGSYINVRGRVVELTANRITIDTPDRGIVRGDLTPEWSVQVMRPIAFEELEIGRFVGAIELPQPSGRGKALEVHMSLPGVRFAEGSMAWDRPFGAQMTQGQLRAARRAANGGELEIGFPGGSRRIVMDDAAPIVLINNEGRENIKVGVEVFVLAWPQPDGRLQVDAVATGPDGSAPPM